MAENSGSGGSVVVVVVVVDDGMADEVLAGTTEDVDVGLATGAVVVVVVAGIVEDGADVWAPWDAHPVARRASKPTIAQPRRQKVT